MFFDTDESTLNLFEAVMRGNEYMRQAKLALEKAKEAVETARKIIDNDPCVLSTKKSNMKKLMDALHREKDESIYRPDIHCLQRNNNVESFPLHWVALLGSHYEMAKLFVLKYYAASKQLTSERSTPLHLACAIDGKEDEIENKRILEQLFAVNPDAVFVKDKWGDCPLHKLCRENTNDNADIIRLILEKFPMASKLRNHRGCLPLHEAIDYSEHCDYNNIETIKVLMEYFPEAASVKTRGNYPIHTALYNCYDEEWDEKALNIVKCVLERSDFIGLFEVFGTLNLRDPDDEDEYEIDAEIEESLNGPPWKYMTPWSTICKKSGRDEALSILEGIGTHHTIIHDAIGKAPIDDISFIIDSKNIDLISSVDANSNKAISVAIHEASKDENEKYWKEYFNPLIEMLFMRECMQKEIAAGMMIDGSEIVNIILDGTAANPIVLDGAAAEEEANQALPVPAENDGNGRCDGNLDNHNGMEIPVSTIANRNGQNLLHVAAKEGLPWFGLEDILESYVDAAYVQDVQSGLVPFMIAGEASTTDLSAIFGVLRAVPDILDQLNKAYHFYGHRNTVSSIGRVDGKRQRLS